MQALFSETKGVNWRAPVVAALVIGFIGLWTQSAAAQTAVKPPGLQEVVAPKSAAKPNQAAAFRAGGMHTTAFSIDGPDMRVFASGSLALDTPDKALDANVVLFLFRQIDNLIGKIPVLNVLLLGSNENLLAAYYVLEGPWADPDARLVPLRSLATGPATLVFEGLPFLVRKSLQAIGAIDGDVRAAPPRPFAAEPPPPAKDS
jgi:hypothetical protein